MLFKNFRKEGIATFGLLIGFFLKLHCWYGLLYLWKACSMDVEFRDGPSDLKFGSQYLLTAN